MSGGSIVSAITQDDESYTEEDSKVSDYPEYVDTCASDIYTPLVSTLGLRISLKWNKLMGPN